MESNYLVTVMGSSQHNWGMCKPKCITYVGRIVLSTTKSEKQSWWAKVTYHGINLCSLQLPRLLGPTHTTQHGGEVPLKLVVVTLCPGDELFDTLVLMSGVIQQVGDTCLQLSLDLLVMKIENILSLLSVARVLVFKSGILLGPTHTTQHGGEVPLKLVVVTLCPGDELFDTLVLVSGVIQQIGDTCLQISLDLLVMEIENILCLLSVAGVLVFKDFTYSELVRGTSRSW